MPVEVMGVCQGGRDLHGGLPVLVMGIDPAWTENKPGGLALVEWRGTGKPAVVALARSYEEFLTVKASQPLQWQEQVHGSPPAMARLVGRAEEMTGDRVGLVALDIPLSPGPVTGRRAADNAVSRAYGGKRASTHTPNAKRPGLLSATIFTALGALGFTWAGSRRPACSGKSPVFLETYPHPAIIEMLGLTERLPYKVGKIRSYWPAWSPPERWSCLTDSMERLREGLLERMDGLAGLLPPSVSLLCRGYPKRRVLTAYENVLDALVCAWVGCEYLAGRVRPYGDETGAIWVPVGLRT